MVKKEIKKVSKLKIKKKLWYKIIAPKTFGQKEAGETYLSEPESALGRAVKINLKELTGNVKDQNVSIGLQINKVSGTILNTSLISYELSPSLVKRMVRKNTNRLDDSFVMKTKGGKGVIIKTIMVTIRKTNKSATSLLRQQLKEYLKEEIGNSTFDTLVYNLSAYKVQSVLKKRLSKIYPLREIAVKVLRLAEKGLVKEEVVVEEKKEVSAEEKALPEKEAVSNAEPEKPEKTALPEMQEDLSEGEELQQ